MTQYRGYSIEQTTTTVGPEIHGGQGNRYMLKVTDKNGHAIRNTRGNLPIITTVAKAKELVDEEIERHGA